MNKYNCYMEFSNKVLKVSNVQRALGLSVDGKDGPRTWDAIEKAIVKPVVSVSSDKNITLEYNNWPKQNYADMVKFYGEVGSNMTSLTLPYEMKLAWDIDVKVSKITCHKKVKDSLERIFKKTLDHYGLEKVKELRLDLFGGCLNIRKMRGGSSWSIHSWGAAIDLDPTRNQLKWGKDKAYFAKPEYAPFWKIVESEGWTSLGQKKDYDWMHFQAADL